MNKQKKSPLGARIVTSPFASPVYAAIDVGSNNVRMDLYGIDFFGKPLKLKKLNATFECRLGEGVSTSFMLKRENLIKAVNALSSFNTILDTQNIKPENICIVMTAAIRSVQHTHQGQKDIAVLANAFNNRPFVVLTDEEEALLDGEAVKIECHSSLRTHGGEKCSIAFAAIGGGSVQLGVVTMSGEIQDTVSLPYGVYPLIEESGGNIQKAGKIFDKILHDYYPDHQHHVLVVLGRRWRALGDAVCNKKPHILRGKDIHDKLLKATRYNQYDQSPQRRVRECAAFMPLSAAMLRRIAKYFDAKKIMFVDTSIRDAIAEQLHARARGDVMAVSSRLERLFSHATP